ncbi:MAG: rod shape-determining protein MreC [Francisellaceae bacterium]|nr:rod shape-determining protein MreC [Francisellaceae bacterium]
MDNSKPIFAAEPIYGFRFIFVLVLSIALMAIDHHYHYLPSIRSNFTKIIVPIQKLSNLPGQSLANLSHYLSSYTFLQKENIRLNQQQLVLNAQLQKLMALESENIRLRALLQSSPKIKESFTSAELIQIDPDPFSHIIVLNKGKTDGVFIGQPLIDANGIMGKIIEVENDTSRAMLITDTAHALPIENLRNGMRAIAVGVGNINRLELQHVPLTADIKEGDELVTSGLGGKYPMGLPVGTVDKVIYTKGAAFSKIWIKPKAHLEQSKQVLLIQPLDGLTSDKDLF